MYNITPISFKGEALGAILTATREPLQEELRPWGRIFADHIGAAIANARAFEEIRVAGKRLEQANQRLERELAERKEAEERLRQSEQRYRRIVDTASEGIWELDEHYATTYVNRRMAEMLGYEPQEMVGRDFREFLFEDDLASLPARIAARRQGLTEHYEQRYRHKDGSTVWMHVSATSVRDAERRFLGSFAMLTDITERKRAEEALRRLNRELRAISNCNQVLLRATDEQSLLKEICRIVCEEAGYRMAWVGYAEHDEAKSVRPVAWTGAEEETLANLGITWADTERGRGPTGTAIRTGKTSCIEDYATDPRVAPWRESALQHGFRSAIALPLKDEQANAFGSLNIYSAQPNAFTSEEIRLLEELAGDLAFGIVTLRSRAARERAEQEVALLSFALDKGHEAAFLIDDTARFHYVNEEACRVLGYTRAELLGMGIADIDPEFPAGALVRPLARPQGAAVAALSKAATEPEMAVFSRSRSARIISNMEAGLTTWPSCVISPSASGRRKRCAIPPRSGRLPLTRCRIWFCCSTRISGSCEPTVQRRSSWGCRLTKSSGDTASI